MEGDSGGGSGCGAGVPVVAGDKVVAGVIIAMAMGLEKKLNCRGTW